MYGGEVLKLKAPHWIAGYIVDGKIHGRKTKYRVEDENVTYYVYDEGDVDRNVLEFLKEFAVKGVLDLASDDEIILYLAAKMNSAMSLYTLLKNIERYITSFIGAEAVSILIRKVDNDEEYLAFLVTEGGASGRIESIKVPMESIAGESYLKAKTLIYNDLEKEKKHFKGVDKAAKFVTKNIVATPLWAGSEKIGVLEALNKEGGFDKKDAEVLEEFSKLISKKLYSTIQQENLKKMLKDIVLSIVSAIDKRDNYTHEHSRNVARVSRLVGEKLGLSEKELEELEISAILHDVGKIGIPDYILLKPGKLTKEEFEYIKRHPIIGAQILSELKYVTESMIYGTLEHHERLDGSGYPYGKKEGELSLFGKIISVVDVYDALTAKRVYKEGWSKEKVLAILKEDAEKGKFDRKVIHAIESLIKEGAI